MVYLKMDLKAMKKSLVFLYFEAEHGIIKGVWNEAAVKNADFE